MANIGEKIVRNGVARRIIRKWKYEVQYREWPQKDSGISVTRYCAIDEWNKWESQKDEKPNSV